MAAARARFGEAGGEAGPVTEREGAPHHAGILPIVVGQAGGGGEGEAVLANDIACAQLHLVDAEAVGGEIDEAFDHPDRLGPAGAAIG